jgi:proteasome lid subunit RPN8/RPN11
LNSVPRLRYTLAVTTRHIQLSSPARAAIIAHLRAAYPHEGCGVLIGPADATLPRIERAFGLSNRMAPSTDDRFEIDPLSYATVEAQLRGSAQRIVGFFHGHPDGQALPSRIDLEMAQGLFAFAREYYVYAIAAVTADGAPEVTFWRLMQDQSAFERLDIQNFR